MARSTKIEALATRERILDAAEQVFHAQGVGHTSLADVAQAAALTRGAIYWHFKNKGDLFHAMAQRVKLPMETMVQAGAEASAADPLAQLRNTLIHILQESAGNPQSRRVFDIIFLNCEFVDPNDSILLRRRQSFHTAQRNFRRTLRNAVAKGQLPEDLDVALAASALQAAVVGLINNWLFMPDQLDLGAQAPRLVDGVLDMVRYAPSMRAPSA
jgi:TetR/AcrR family acrAB operon transcriptional repressor